MKQRKNPVIIRGVLRALIDPKLYLTIAYYLRG